MWRWTHNGSRNRRVGTIFSILNFQQEFGHFLIEVLPKLFSIRRLMSHGLWAPVAWPTTAPAYMEVIAKSIIPDLKFVPYDPADETLLTDYTILPGSMGMNHEFHPQLVTDLQEYSLNIGSSVKIDRLFISRAGLERQSPFRRLINHTELEDLARKHNFTIIQPETLAHKIQVGLFSNAKIILGEFGSGLHNAIFSAYGTKIIACNWVTGAQSKIANLCGHDVGYQLPFGGRPRTVSDTASPDTFNIDIDDLNEKMEDLLH